MVASGKRPRSQRAFERAHDLDELLDFAGLINAARATRGSGVPGASSTTSRQDMRLKCPKTVFGPRLDCRNAGADSPTGTGTMPASGHQPAWSV